MKEILGKKLGMTRIFAESGEAISVTVIEAGPCPVLARKTVAKDGYEAYVVGHLPLRKGRANKPTAGRFAKSGAEPTRVIREVRNDQAEFEAGQNIEVDIFHEGERVDVSGVSRGLGFAGTIKRHGFAMALKTHGQSDRLRSPGSIGQASYPARVFKGKKMPGRMGNDNVTVLNLEIIKIIKDENLMLVKGAVPGSSGSLLKVRISNRGR